MRTKWWVGLTMGLAACSPQLEVAPEVILKQQYKAAFQQQVQLLQAEQVKVAAVPASNGGPAVLTLEVVNPRTATAQHPDTLKQRMRKLAHLLVADLASPAGYQAVSAQATFRRSFSSPGNASSSQTFIYPLASLR